MRDIKVLSSCPMPMLETNTETLSHVKGADFEKKKGGKRCCGRTTPWPLRKRGKRELTHSIEIFKLDMYKRIRG